MNTQELSTAELEQLLANRKKDERAKAEKEKAAYEQGRDEMITKVITTAKALFRELGEFKQFCHIEMDNQAVKLSEYGKLRSNSKGGFSVTDSEDTMRVTRRRDTEPVWDERSTKAVELIKDFLGDAIKKRDTKMYEILMSFLERNAAGELEHLTPERVWKETESALTTRNPQVFFQVLRDCGALHVLFPEVDALFGVPAPAQWHPEIDTGIHTLMTLSMAAMLSPEVDVRFATLCHDLGKALTPKALWPRHHGHGPAGVKLVEQLCQRLRVPNDIRDLAKLVAEFHDLIHTFPILQPKTIVKLFDSIDAWRKPQRVEQIALTSEADVRGRTGFEAADYPQGRLLREAWLVAQAVPTKDVVEAGFKGQAIREELTRRRIAAVANWKEKRDRKSVV